MFHLVFGHETCAVGLIHSYLTHLTFVIQLGLTNQSGRPVQAAVAKFCGQSYTSQFPSTLNTDLIILATTIGFGQLKKSKQIFEIRHLEIDELPRTLTDLSQPYCSKILYHGLNHGLFLLLFNFLR